MFYELGYILLDDTKSSQSLLQGRVFNQKERTWNENKLRSRSFIPTLPGVFHNTVKVSYVWLISVFWWYFFVFEKHLVQRYPIYFPYKNGPTQEWSPTLITFISGITPDSASRNKNLSSFFQGLFFPRKSWEKKPCNVWQLNVTHPLAVFFCCHHGMFFFPEAESWS